LLTSSGESHNGTAIRPHGVRFRRLLLLANLVAGCGDPWYPGEGFELLILPDSLVVEETQTLDVQLVWVGADGKAIAAASQRAVWISGDESVAGVSDGTIRAIGPGQSDVFAVLDSAVAQAHVTVGVRYASIAAGDRTCGLTRRGTLYCWGDADAPPDRVAGAHPFGMVTVGSSGTAGTGFDPSPPRSAHTCAVDADGTASCWGANRFGQLGDGTTTDSEQPREIRSSVRFEMVAAGANHSCGVSTAGDAYCWGLNTLGELGIGTTDYEPHAAPGRVAGALKWIAITAGDGFSCGRTDAGQIYCWGDGSYGVLGDGTIVRSRSEPGLVLGDHQWIDLDAGPRQVCAIDVRRDLYCWGMDPAGVAVATPERRDNQYYYRAVSAGGGETDDFVCAVTTHGPTYCWSGAHGQAGIFERYLPPAAWVFDSVAAGALHACGMTVGGLVHCWGSGYGIAPRLIPYQLPETGDGSVTSGR
jgi:hypothetical protein